jgi:hypothetical protein
LIRYLLDELHHYENDYSDALCPIPREATKSLFGEHRQEQHVTVGYLDSALVSVRDSFNHSLKQTLDDVFRKIVPQSADPNSSSAPALLHSSPLPNPIIRKGTQNSMAWRMFVPSGSAPKRISPSGQVTVGTVPSDIKIPSAPKGVPVKDRWTWWIKDWYQADEGRGNRVAHSEWEKDWYEGPGGPVWGSAYNQHRLVAAEYER